MLMTQKTLPRIISLILLVLSFHYTTDLPGSPPDSDSHLLSGFPDSSDYISLLQEFPRYAEKLWHSNYRGDSQLGYFGTGAHDHNQMRSHANFIFVYALLATDEAYDAAVSGVERNQLLDRARAALRYLTDTHISGNRVCTDGRKWGKQPEQWLAPWVISKAVAGARLIWGDLTPIEKRAMRRVVVNEANYQLKYPAASRVYDDTHAEFNAMNSEVLAWAVNLYPTHPNASSWRLKAQEFFMNTLSVAQDSQDTTIVDDKPVNQWVYTTNVHPDFTLEGHGAYQFDYIAVPLHSLTWAYYAFVSHGQSVPESLFHHVLDVWNVLKGTHLYSGRFAYMQGKDWARHVYGPYFIVPMLVLLQNEFGDADARFIEQLRFGAFQWEQAQNVSGSIFSRRFGYQRSGWPVIYETDCYANLGLAYLLHQFVSPIRAEDPDIFQQKTEGSFYSKYCQFLYSRDKTLFASFSWEHLSRRYPMALFVPGDDYMVEWAEGNLIGEVVVENADMHDTTQRHNSEVIDDGFVTTGHLQEGKRNGLYSIDHYISFTALPKKQLAVMIEYLVAKESINVTKQSGLSYQLPNDIFNDNLRNIYWEDNITPLRGSRGTSVSTTIDSKWINIDDKFGIISLSDNGRFRIRAENRNIWNGQICERIDYEPESHRRRYRQGDVIREQAYFLISGGSQLTRTVAKNNVHWLQTDRDLIKAVSFKNEGSNCLIVVNFDRTTANATVNLSTGETLKIQIPALSTQVREEAAGAELVHPKDNGTMVLVPAGEFVMGTSHAQLQKIVRGRRDAVALKEIFAHEQPQHRVYVDSFYIDKYEVTNAQFEKFTEATGYLTDAEKQGWGYLWEGSNVWPRPRGASWKSPRGAGDNIRGKMNHPVVQVSYNDALAYLKWVGKRLPTEAEWEKASRGTDGRMYPWGNEWDATRLNSWEKGPHRTTRVGRYPKGASPYGAYDMIGNVWEWVLDWYHPTYYRTPREWSNPTGPAKGKHHVLRGACWLNEKHVTRCAHRDNYVSVPDFRIHLGGFRGVVSATRFAEGLEFRNPEDVNFDGLVNLFDLVIVASRFGQTLPGDSVVDVNRDGVVDVLDLISVASRFGEQVASPSAFSSALSLSEIELNRVQQALSSLELLRSPSLEAQAAKRVLRDWLDNTVTAISETKLLSNYPNPFNPETWIPYQLGLDAEVRISIYDAAGGLVCRLNLGHQKAGSYRKQSKAAYWDGKSLIGAPVSSGLYFYHLQAGDFSAVKRMAIIK